MMKKLWMGLIALVAMIVSSQAADIIVDDFSSSTVTKDFVRVAETDIDAGWQADSGGPSAWEVTGGQLQNSSTDTTAIGEGAVAQVVSHAADTNNMVDISIDYTVAAGDTLYVHLWGLDSPAAPSTWFANFQASNGALFSNTERITGESYNLKDGQSDTGGLVASGAQALVALTGSGTYTNSIGIEALGISGITTAGDFEYYLLGFARNEDGLAGTTSIDNLSITTSYAAPPPPEAPAGIVWENDMSTDPISGAEPNWVVRGAANGYTIANGLLTMNAGAWSALLDTNPYDEFQGTTKVDLEWRATSVTDPAGFGAGIWCNIDGDPAEYGAIWIHAVLLSNDTQTVKITSAGDGGTDIATITGLSTNMLTLHAVLDAFNQTVDYEITDGVITASDVVSYTPNPAAAGTTIGFTLFTGGPGAEVDYVRVEANAAPDEVYFAADPAALAMSLFEADSTVDGSLDISYNAATNLDVTITISDENYPGSLIVLSDTNQVVFAPGTSTLDFQFDRTVANVMGGEVATGLVTIAWSEVGGGESGSVLVPISGSVGYSAAGNAWTGAGNGVNWGDADNWNLARVPGAVAADFVSITDGSTVTVATTAPDAFAPLGSLTIGSTSTLNVDADLPATKVLTISGVLDINGGTFTIDNADAGHKVSGTGLIKVQSGTLQTTATIAQRVDNYECAFEISGGTVNIGHQAYYTGGLTVIGDAATLNIDYWNGAGVFTFEMGASGISTIDGSGSWGHLGAASITVDGSAYTGGSAAFTLFKSSNLASTSTAVTVTGFAAEYTAEVTQDMGTDLVTLTITAPPYKDWLVDYDLTGADALSTANPDGDVVNNLYEYGLGGDPTNSADIGMDSAMIVGAGYMDYVHVRRVGASNEISYALALTGSLVHGPWTTNAGYTVEGYGPEVDGFDTVTNRIDTTGKTAEFIELIIEEL